MYERRHWRRTHSWAAWMTCAVWPTCASRPTGIPRRARSSAKSSSTQVTTWKNSSRSTVVRRVLTEVLMLSRPHATQSTKHIEYAFTCWNCAVRRPDELGEDVLGSAEFPARRVGHLLRAVEAARL